MKKPKISIKLSAHKEKKLLKSSGFRWIFGFMYVKIFTQDK